MEKSAKEMRDEAANFFPEVKTLFLGQEGISSTPKTMEMNSSYSTSTGLAHYNYSSDTYSTDSSSISGTSPPAHPLNSLPFSQCRIMVDRSKNFSSLSFLSNSFIMYALVSNKNNISTSQLCFLDTYSR